MDVNLNMAMTTLAPNIISRGLPCTAHLHEGQTIGCISKAVIFTIIGVEIKEIN